MENQDKFLFGILYTIQLLVLHYDQLALAKEIVVESGYGLDDFLDAQKQSEYQDEQMIEFFNWCFKDEEKNSSAV